MRSNSAEKVAMLRAFGSRERDAAIRNPDYLAGRFAATTRMYRLGLALASVAPLRAGARRAGDLIAEGGYWTEVVRVKHYDEILLAEAGAGVAQVVVLGAGLDSRAYRFSERLGGVEFFEVDHPTMEAFKRGRVEATLGRLPDHVTYVAHDLEAGGLDRVLADAGFDPTAPALVLWIGVSMYLPREAADSVLSWAGGLADGSSIGFDYMEQGFFADRRRFGPAGRFRLFIGLSGERLLTGFDDDSVAGAFERSDLSLVSLLAPREAESRYLRRSNGRLAGPVFPYWRYAHLRAGG